MLDGAVCSDKTLLETGSKTYGAPGLLWRTPCYNTVNKLEFGIMHTHLGARSMACRPFELEEAIGLSEISSLFNWTSRGFLKRDTLSTSPVVSEMVHFTLNPAPRHGISV